MIDSFRALSSFSSLPLSLWLIIETCSLSHYPHPSLLFSTRSLRTSVAFPCVFIHPSPGKEGCHSRRATSPSSHPPRIPSSLPTFIHLSFPSITVALFLLPLSPPFFSPSISFIPVSLGLFFRKMCSLSAFLQTFPLFILVLLSPLLHSFFDLSFPC